MSIKPRFNPDTHYAITERHPAADTSHVARKYLDITYANLSPAQRLDIYLPEREDEPYPVILSIHGGAFMAGDKADDQVLPMLEGLKRGYAVVALNYRLSWEAVFPALIQDVKAAVRWVRANADRYNFNPDWITSWGGSAGGYLSSMLGTSAGIPELEDLSLGNSEQSCGIQAVVDWYGPTDFLKMDRHLTESGFASLPGTEHSGANSPESLLLGDKITEIPELVKAANPATYIRADAPPFLIQHGTDDRVVPVQQSMEFAEKLKTVLGESKVILEVLEGAEHADELFETPENVARVLDFLEEKLTKI